jgi:hypothetical protein
LAADEVIMTFQITLFWQGYWGVAN